MGYAIIVFLAIFASVTIRNFRYGLFIFLAALPAYLIRFQIPLGPPLVKGEVFLPTTMLEVMFWILFIIWILRYVIPGLPARRSFGEGGTRNPEKKLLWIPAFARMTKGIIVAVVLFFLSSVLAIFVSPNHLAALGIWRAYFLEPILFFLMLIAECRLQNNSILNSKFKIPNSIVWPLAISVFYISAVAILQRFFGWPIPFPWQAELRVTSIFDYPNAVGLFVAPILLLILAMIINKCHSGQPATGSQPDPESRKKRFWIPASAGMTAGRVFLVVTFILGILAIFLAQSDGAIIGLAAGLAVFGLLYNKKTRLAVAIAIIVISVVILAVPGVGERVANQFLLGDWSGYVRQTMWGETWQMLKDSFVFGAGLAGYQTVFVPYHKAQGIEIFLYPHNIIFNFWSELGMLGLVGFILMIVWFFKKTIKIVIPAQAGIQKKEMNPRVREDDNRVWLLAALSSMIVILVHGLVDVPYFKNDLAFLFWTIFAVPFIWIPTD